VGGTVFQTTRATLCKDSESMLAVMFSGRFNLHEDKDGSLFIDRDGTHFRYILNYLRDVGKPVLPADHQSQKELLREAEYYQLIGLIEALNEALTKIT